MLSKLDSVSLALGYLLQKYISMINHYMNSIEFSGKLRALVSLIKSLLLDISLLVKHILSFIDYCGQLITQDFVHISKQSLLISQDEFWQYLYSNLIEHIIDHFYFLALKYLTKLNLSFVNFYNIIVL